MKKSDKIWKLILEARGSKGMIAEIACKCRLLSSQVESGSESNVEESLRQMQADLDKYSKRLDEI